MSVFADILVLAALIAAAWLGAKRGLLKSLAGLLIVVIETGLTVSLAVNLAAFFLLRANAENSPILRSTAKSGEKP